MYELYLAKNSYKSDACNEPTFEIYNYGLFNILGKNQELLLGPTAILPDIGEKGDKHKKRPANIINVEEQLANALKSKDKDELKVIVVYGGSGSGKTFLIEQYLEKMKEKNVFIETIYLWNFDKKEWYKPKINYYGEGESLEELNELLSQKANLNTQELEQAMRKQKEALVNKMKDHTSDFMTKRREQLEHIIMHTIIRSTPQNINSSRQHRCVHLSNNTCIFDLCGAEGQLTPEKVCEGWRKHYASEKNNGWNIEDQIKIDKRKMDKSEEFKADIPIVKQLLLDHFYVPENIQNAVEQLTCEKLTNGYKVPELKKLVGRWRLFCY